MKVFKNPIFMFILGVFISSGIMVFAEYVISADKIEYSTNISVKDKIDDLYTKVKPTYTGSTIVNPITGSNPLILQTAGKILNSDITINPIPNSFTDVSLSTITSTDDIMSGKKAYKPDGTLITGTGNKSIIQNFSIDSNYSNSTYKFELGFQPSLIYIAWQNGYCWIYVNNKQYVYNTTNGTGYNSSFDGMIITNTGFNMNVTKYQIQGMSGTMYVMN